MRSRRFFTRAEVSDDLRTLHQDGRPGGRRLLPGPLEPRQGGALHARRELHRLVLVEGLRQGRHHHLGDPADRLPVGRARTRPDYEPRGCPRGAAFSWYTYSPTRVRYPYVRGVLLQMYREAKSQHGGDPVKAWAHIVDNPAARQGLQVRPRQGRPRPRHAGTRPPRSSPPPTCTRSRSAGPDRVAGFSPIPAMSMVSHASGARFVILIGGSMLSFYDWYADLPVASPQVFGDQTDVPESGDWWDAGYLIMWGSNVPVTRTPDAHWMTEARYRGQKVVAVAPDYADNVKFADEWLPARPGTDGALAMAMGHVDPQGVLRRPADAVLHRLRQAVHRPAVPRAARRGGRRRRTVAGQVPDRGRPARARGTTRTPHFNTVLLDAAQRRAGRPERVARPPLRRHRARPVEPRPRRRRPAALPARHAPRTPCRCELPRFDAPDGAAARPERGVPVRRVGGTWSPPSST